MRTNRNRIVTAGDVILRYPLKEHDRADLVDHADRQQRAHDAGLPVPPVLEVQPDRPRPYMVMARVPGVPLMEAQLSESEALRFAQDVVAFMRAMWAVDWPAADPAWPVIWQVLARVVPSPQTRHAADIAISADLRLTHGDLSPGNLMVGDGGTLTGVIDWDAALLSDPAMDWSALLANTPESVSGHLRTLLAESAELERRAAAYIDTWGIQHDLWQAGEHPWLLGDRALAEPRL